MAKRPRWLDRPENNKPGYLTKLAMSGRGVSEAVIDRASWLGDNTSGLDPWVTALEAIDKRRNKTPLLNLLKSERDLPHLARLFLADLIARHQLKKKRGGQSIAAYDRTEVDAVLEKADLQAKELIQRGRTPQDACAEAERAAGIPDGFLFDFHCGKRGSSARMKTRRT